MQDKLQEDTVSADRKERIIYVGPGKTRKISSITSRQNFDNEKFTRREKPEDDKEEVKESTQTTGTSQIDNGAPTQSDNISKDKPKKSNNPQIEFVTGTAMPNGSSSTAIGNAQNMGIKKISEDLVKKALAQVQEGKMGEKAADVDFHAKATDSSKPPFDGPYTKTPSTVVDKSGARHTPMSRVRDLARQAMKKQSVKEEVTQVEEGVAGAVAGAVLGGITAGPVGALAGGYLGHKTQQGANASKAVKKKIVKEEETTMSKTYADFIQQLQEYNAGKDGVYRHKGSYGGSYDSNDDHDEDEPKKPAAPAVKRGRGRPAGSKSGANQKVTTGKSYGGIATHTLSLPNSK